MDSVGDAEMTGEDIVFAVFLAFVASLGLVALVEAFCS
jgi:hypothetical protein